MVLHYMGHLNGYIMIPEDVLDKLDDLEVLDDLDCHGGVTFSERMDESDLFENGYWVGFDTAHLGDIPNMELVEKYLGEENLNLIQERINFTTEITTSTRAWGQDQVKKELEKMVLSLEKLVKEN
jgi:hypothetical protein